MFDVGILYKITFFFFKFISCVDVLAGGSFTFLPTTHLTHFITVWLGFFFPGFLIAPDVFDSDV